MGSVRTKLLNTWEAAKSTVPAGTSRGVYHWRTCSAITQFLHIIQRYCRSAPHITSFQGMTGMSHAFLRFVLKNVPISELSFSWDSILKCKRSTRFDNNLQLCSAVYWYDWRKLEDSQVLVDNIFTTWSDTVTRRITFSMADAATNVWHRFISPFQTSNWSSQEGCNCGSLMALICSLSIASPFHQDRTSLSMIDKKIGDIPICSPMSIYVAGGVYAPIDFNTTCATVNLFCKMF